MVGLGGEGRNANLQELPQILHKIKSSREKAFALKWKNLATCHVVKNNVQLGLYIQNCCLVLVSTENVDFLLHRIINSDRIRENHVITGTVAKCISGLLRHLKLAFVLGEVWTLNCLRFALGLVNHEAAYLIRKIAWGDPSGFEIFSALHNFFFFFFKVLLHAPNYGF